jgi:hypothetical protein
MNAGEAENGTQHEAGFPLVFRGMKRRSFLKFSLFAAIATQTSRSAVASALDPSARYPDKFFYDDRFGDAQAMSGRLDRSATLTPVQGDVTKVWTDDLKRLSQQRSLTLRGVTTESFHFCLTRLLRSHARVETRIRRVGKDLYAWSITSTLSKTG